MSVKERGLRKDKNDQRALRHGKERYIGFSFEDEFCQYMPFFYSAEGNVDYKSVGNYRGGHAFLICSGPSFAKIDQTKLKNVYTFGVNNSPASYRPDGWACVDDPARFMKSIWLDPKIDKYVPFDHIDKPLWNNVNDSKEWGPLVQVEKRGGKEKEKQIVVQDCPNVTYFRRNEKFKADRFLWEHTINWGDHSNWGGGRSVMLAAFKILWLLGFRHVYLLGVDLNMDDKSKYHFPQERDKGAQRGNMSTYKKMIEVYYPELQKEFKKFGFNVYNCNEESKLKIFQYMSFDEAIHNATKDLSLDKELSYGMYRTFAEKKQDLNEDRKKIASNTYLPPEYR